MDYLTAINLLLRKVGTRAVSSPDINHPDVADAKEVLTIEIGNILNRGWWFNKRASVRHSPDSSGYINLGANVIRIEPDRDTRRIYPELSLRGNRVYDVTNNTFTLASDIVVDEYIELDWEHIPHTAHLYIAYTAASEFVSDKLEDTAKANKLERTAREHLEDLHADELRSTKPNMLESPNARHMLSGVQPYWRY